MNNSITFTGDIILKDATVKAVGSKYEQVTFLMEHTMWMGPNQPNKLIKALVHIRKETGKGAIIAGFLKKDNRVCVVGKLIGTFDVKGESCPVIQCSSHDMLWKPKPKDGQAQNDSEW